MGVKTNFKVQKKPDLEKWFIKDNKQPYFRSIGDYDSPVKSIDDYDKDEFEKCYVPLGTPGTIQTYVPPDVKDSYFTEIEGSVIEHFDDYLSNKIKADYHD